MKPIFGPFLPDPNVPVSLVAFDDLVWIINRRALHDGAEKGEQGVAQLDDVRAYRRRSLDEATLASLPEEVGWWAAQLDDSEYLRETMGRNVAASRGAGSHAHFIVKDGWDRVIEVIARSLSCRMVSDSAPRDICELVRSGRVEEFLR